MCELFNDVILIGKNGYILYLGSMNNKNNNINIADEIITHCARCHELMLSSDKLVIPTSGDEDNIACKACHDKGWTDKNIEYRKCLVLDHVYCPTCDEFIVGFIPDDSMYMQCVSCTNYINILSYKDMHKK